MIEGQDRAGLNSALSSRGTTHKQFLLLKHALTLLTRKLYVGACHRILATLSGSPSSYRDRIYIVKDIILKLVEYGELNQTALVSFCGLNLKKHKVILDDLQQNGLITRSEIMVRKRVVAIYRPTPTGIEFCRNILEPYETMFPRRKDDANPVDGNNNNINNNDKSSRLAGMLLLI